jgi:hypothetical protein
VDFTSLDVLDPKLNHCARPFPFAEPGLDKEEVGIVDVDDDEGNVAFERLPEVSVESEELLAAGDLRSA